MRPLGEATARVSGKSFSRKYIALGRILNNWEEIVGKDLADKAQPVKIRYYKKEKQKKPRAALDIAVSPAQATLLHYQKGLILERINHIFGDKWITAIKFVTRPANNKAVAPEKKEDLPPLTPSEKKRLSTVLDKVADKDIQERLSRLGQAIVQNLKT